MPLLELDPTVPAVSKLTHCACHMGAAALLFKRRLASGTVPDILVVFKTVKIVLQIILDFLADMWVGWIQFCSLSALFTGGQTASLTGAEGGGEAFVVALEAELALLVLVEF